MSTLHEKLLARLDEEDIGDNVATALRAVVELHAPEFFGGHIACLACSPGMPPPILVLWRDCSTIQAIARELGVDHA